MIDLRSDTVTKPTPEMRKVMAEAEVGDDVWGDDPSVKALEEKTAEILGMESAVFMPSGTMTNQVAVRTHTQPGDELLIEQYGHIYGSEAGGAAALSGVSTRLIHGERGMFLKDDLAKMIRTPDEHQPLTTLVCVENTCNRGGGTVWPLQQLRSIVDYSHQQKLNIHMDGARLWNAAVASKTSEAEILKGFDSVSVCFSKGLGAPVGSALAGSKEFIRESRRFRKLFGGAMRQSGVLAAAAHYALDHHRDRLAEDHENAQTLAFGLAEIRGIKLNPKNVETNIIFFELENVNASYLAEKLEQQSILVEVVETDLIRVVTNLMVDEKQILIVLESILSEMSQLN